MKRSGLTAWPFIAVALIVGYAYLWTVTSNHVAFDLRAGQRDYYNLLVHGFLKGRLGLDVEVPRPLLECPDPYDPAQRPPGVTLHDASLYRGKYYIYYGVVPAIAVLLPFRLVTGLDLPLSLAVLGFALGQFTLILLLVADLRRRFFPGCTALMAALLAGAAGFASCAPVLLRRSSMYELPIIAGSFFALAALGCMYRAWVSQRDNVWWLAAASAAWGLAVGSRPIHLLAAGVVILFPWLYRSTDSSRPVNGRRLWIASLVPITTIGLLLAAYNFARFGNPAEFGLRYILSGVYEAKIQHFEPRYVLPNVRTYFFAGTAWGRYFPFLHEVATDGTRPAQYSVTDHPFGLLLHVPLIWLGVCAVRRRNRADPNRDEVYRRFVFTVAATAIGTAGFLVFFYAAAARYLGDFAPVLALFGAIGGLAATERLGATASATLRFWGQGAIAALAIVSIATVFLFSVQLFGQLRSVNPRAYARVERIANRPVHWLEQVVGIGSRGALLIRAELPGPASIGRTEELVRTGWGGNYDHVAVVYPSRGRVAFEYQHTGAPVVRSADIAVDASKPHAITVLMGSLLPPSSWPGYASWPADELLAAQRHVQVCFDDQVMIDRYQRFYAGGVDSLVIGGRGEPVAFSGRILFARREPLATTRARLLRTGQTTTPTFAADARGAWHLAVQFPPGAPGVREPLVVSGETGRGDFVAVEYLSDRRVMFLFDHWGKGALLSNSFIYEPGREYQIEVSHPGYIAHADDDPIRPGALRIKVDGRDFWQLTTPLYPADPQDCYIGWNPVGGASCNERFGGRISAGPR